jgi:hypothetical protein
MSQMLGPASAGPTRLAETDVAGPVALPYWTNYDSGGGHRSALRVQQVCGPSFT